MKKIQFVALLAIHLILCISCNSTEKKTEERERIPLEGKWLFDLDPSDKGETEKWYNKTLSETVSLPGTTDENKKGTKNLNTEETTRLSRVFYYEGKAWYSKEINIPLSFIGKQVTLCLERTKAGKVWLDSIFIGSANNILTPQLYDLSKSITPGRHKLTILVDNGPESVPDEIKGSHAWTDNTQTNWNGIIGDLYIEAAPSISIQSVQVFPNLENNTVIVHLRISNKEIAEKNGKISFAAEAFNTPKKSKIKVQHFPLLVSPRETNYEFTLSMGSETQLWSDISPALYALSITLEVDNIVDYQTVNFGMRHFSTEGTNFTINNKKIFLRGKHDACVFPLTGYPPMNKEEWIKVFNIAKSYGINHYRFHSWTPPKAAFEAADIVGIYIQTELPFWGILDKGKEKLNTFLKTEGDLILDNYGNHASFVMMALGNELTGDDNIMRGMVESFKTKDTRHLYAFGSNNYLGMYGQGSGEDYLVSSRIGADTDSSFTTHIRSSFSFADAYKGGYLNALYPSTRQTYENGINNCLIPVISHENGQFQVFPDFKEIEKYKGILKPYNLMTFKKRLERRELDDQIDEFHNASMAFSIICYKADIEMALRTKGFGGFQILDLQDYPGQGTALVGILDAFMETKRGITPKEFSQFNNQIVPLALFDKYCWSNNETFECTVELANYSQEEIEEGVVDWQIKDDKGKVIEVNQLMARFPQGEVTKAGVISFSLQKISHPTKLTLQLSLEGTDYHNSYDLWVYPEIKSIIKSEKVQVATDVDALLIKSLDEGNSVLLFPDAKKLQGIALNGLFTPDYWNFSMFRRISEGLNREVSPGTLTLFTNPSHPLFKEFPTESHSNWQWWIIVRNSLPLILDEIPGSFKPIVQVVDNINRCHRLGLVFEFAVGKGKLLVCMANPEAIVQTVEGKQFYNSLIKYAESPYFQPSVNISGKEVLHLFDVQKKMHRHQTTR
ncbi:MAG: glycoside hydrolase [Bacteroidales bacterium]|nr:glycoside hydrolase [Bacteroidales bacterium]